MKKNQPSNGGETDNYVIGVVCAVSYCAVKFTIPHPGLLSLMILSAILAWSILSIYFLLFSYRDVKNVALPMRFRAHKEDGSYWAVYKDDHYGFTTGQGGSVAELLRNCESGAKLLISFEDDSPCQEHQVQDRPLRRLVPQITLEWETED